MPSKKSRDFALLGRIWAEIGAGRITEAFISDARSITDGYFNGSGHITINPAHQTVDSLIHEILHRLHPQWAESYIRRTTTYLRRRMSDEEVQAMYAEFHRRARKRKRPLKIED